MKSFNVSDLRTKAEQGFNTAKDRAERYRQPPSASKPPPAPPSTSTSPPVSRAPPPAPPSRNPSTQFQQQPQPQSQQQQQLPFRFSNLSPADKDAFFALLDQYFAHRLGQQQQQQQPPQPPSDDTRPTGSIGSITTTADASDDAPPALEFCNFFHPSTPWSSEWYSSAKRTPPPLLDRSDVMYTSSWRQAGTNMTVQGGVLFDDLTYAWYQVSWNASSPSTPPSRDARYTDPPPPLDYDSLYRAYESYSEGIALFGEKAVENKVPVSRGECWDLANESLKQFSQWPQIPKPVQSINRTHGHLIYHGQPGSGTWRGGDDRIRRGDIVEWRKVTIRQVGMPSTSHCTLGEPEHTALILHENLPSVSVKDGSSISPNQLGPLQVAEQSPGKMPESAWYDMSTMSKGLVWIYRPVSIEAYLKYDLSPEWPPDSNRPW